MEQTQTKTKTPSNMSVAGNLALQLDFMLSPKKLHSMADPV
jgi:hypothetical protein